MTTDFQTFFNGSDSLDLTEVAEVEQSRIHWDADGSITINLVERGEVTVRRDGSEITVTSEKTAREATRELLYSVKSESYDRVVETLEKLDSAISQELWLQGTRISKGGECD